MRVTTKLGALETRLKTRSSALLLKSGILGLATVAGRSLARLLPLLAIFLLALIMPSARAAVDTVTRDADDGSAGTLRVVIANAAAGDVIVFSPGVARITLMKGEIVISQPITVSGPGVAVNGNNSSRVFEIGNASGVVTLAGLTVQDGNANPNGSANGVIGGGAVVVDNSADVALLGCVLTANSGGLTGGAIANFGTVTMTGCSLTGNSAGALGGGGLASYGNGSTTTLTDCTLSGNSCSAYGAGGGLENEGLLTLADCTISGNSGAGFGGGIADYATLTMTGCTISGNSTSNGGDGGGLALLGATVDNKAVGGTAVLTDCAFSGDSANAGGGLYNGFYCTATLTDCTFAGDTAKTNATGGDINYGTGGGIFNNATLTMTGCALTGNVAQGGSGGSGQIGSLAAGGGIENEKTLTLTSCTFTGNSVTAGAYSLGGGGLHNSSGSTATLTDDILYGDSDEVSFALPPGDGPAGSATETYCDIQGRSATPDANHDFGAAPEFVSATAPYDLHLQNGSPCAGTGTASAPAYRPDDIDGRPRPTPGYSRPSIGAYEAAPTGPYSLVAENTTDAAPMSLRADVQCADDYPNAAITFDAVNGPFGSPQTITLTSGRLLLNQPTSITGPAAGVAVDGNNSSRVFEINNASGVVTLAGLTVQNGSAGSGSGGGALADTGASLALMRCAFIANSAPGGDGGALCDLQATVTATACLFVGNSAYVGGGIYAAEAGLTLTGCTVSGNSAGSYGGGLVTEQGTATLTDDIFYGDAGGEVTPLLLNTVTASYSDIGAALGPYSGGGDGVTDGGHNLDLNPLFVLTYNSATGAFNLNVQPGSPVVAAGVAAAGNATDITGRPRAKPPTIGAYEGMTASSRTGISVNGGATVPYNTSVPVVVTVTNTSGSAAPTGVVNVSFGDGSQVNGQTLTASSPDTATFTTTHTYTRPGNYSVSAQYTPAARNFNPSNGNVTITVGKATPTLALSSSSPNNAAVYGTPVTLTATLTGGDQPGGGVTFTDSVNGGAPTTLAANVPVRLSNGVYTATYTAQNTGALPVGTNSITASYGGDANNALTATPAALMETITAGTPTANSQGPVPVPFDSLGTPLSLTGSDPDVPALSLTYAVAVGPAHGTLSGFNASTGSVTYTPNAGYAGSDSFTFTVSNGTNTSTPATVSLTVAAGVPTANAQSVAVAFNTAKAITLTGTDPDVPALPLTYAIVTGPTHGSLSGTAPRLTYTPAANYAGPDSFTFTVNNGTNTSAPATVSLTVNPIFLSTLTFPTPVEGGSVFNGTVTLSGITPVDVVVGLSSSDSSVIRIHRAVIVPAGSSSAAFEIDTFRSHVTKTVTIYATLNQVTLTKDLTIMGR